jgi:hypothetical protein
LKEKKKHEKKNIGILVCGLLIATVLPTVGIMTDEEISTRFGLSDKSLNHNVTPKNMMDNSYGGIFIQLPYLPGNRKLLEWASEPTRKIFENFNGTSSPICDIHW